MRTCFRAFLVLGLLLLSAGVAWADAKDVVRTIRGHLEDAECKKARKALEGAGRATLLGDTKQIREVCAQLADNADGIVQDAADLDHAEELLHAFEVFGREAVEKHADNADVRRGMACVLLAKARYQTAMREGEGATLWKQASDLCLEAARVEKEAEHLVAASRYMRDAAIRLATPPVHEHLEAAARILADAEAAFPGSGVVELERGRVDLLRARVALAGRDKKQACVLARGILERVEPLTAKSTSLGADAGAAWNRTVSFLLQHKLDKKVEFKTRPVVSRWKYLALEVPSGSHWRVQQSRSSGSTMTTLTRWDEGGGRTRIRLRRYKWTLVYTFDDGEMGGDNVKGLMDQARKGDVGWLSKVTKQKKLIKGRLNREISKTTGYEMRALDEDGDPWWIRTFYFKGDEHRRTFCVRVSRYRLARQGLEPDSDPEIEMILDSIRELPKGDN